MKERPGGISLRTVLRFVDLATDALAETREEIDALNVYPVPDGDTGTNMYLTLSAGQEAARAAAEQPGAHAGTVLPAFSRGLLLGARGNSGVILSQLLGAVVHRIGHAGEDERNAALLADALVRAADAAYAAVGVPVEGTILTVARAAADAATKVVEDPQARSRSIFTEAARAAREALARTPEQLPMLAAAGVVDAGGRGLSVILDAAEALMTGRRAVPVTAPRGHTIPIPHAGLDLTADGPAYEVMYLLDAEADAIPPLRERLAGLGDSLVVVGGDGLWNVHVHVDDVGAAVEAGIDAGRPHRIRVTHFADQLAAAAAAQRREGRSVVAVTAGPGLASIFADCGAQVVEGGPGRRPSAAMLLETIVATGTREVIVLPNDNDSLRVADLAARMAEDEHGVRVAVIPTRAQVQGLAALAVHEPGRSFDADVLEMTATARHARHGAVTVAARQAMTMAGACEPGDVLGVIERDFALVGADMDEIARATLDRLLGAGGELVTIVAGADDTGGLAERLAEHVASSYPTLDVVVYDGGQPRYPLLLCVE